MIITSPTFCAEEFRSVTDMTTHLETVVNHFKLRAYVMRLSELFLTEVWLKEVDLNHGPDCTVMQICGTVKFSRIAPTPILCPTQWVIGSTTSKVNEIVSREFGKSFESDFGGINGQIPQWAIDSLRIKLEILASKAEPVLT